MVAMTRDWKVRERAINEHVVNALRAAMAQRRANATQVAKAAGVTQQQMSKWLGAKADNDLPVLTVPRFAAICKAAGLDPGIVFAFGVDSAREAGLFDQEHEPVTGPLAIVFQFPPRTFEDVTATGDN